MSPLRIDELLALRDFARKIRSIEQYQPWRQSPDWDVVKSAVRELDAELAEARASEGARA